MAASFVGTNGWVASNSAASVTPTIHASAIAGDLMLLLGGCRQGSAGVMQVSGWTQLVQRTSTAGGNNQRAAIFWKIHDGSESDPVLALASGTSFIAGCVQVWRNAGATLVETSDESASSSPSPQTLTGEADLGLMAGDFLVNVLSIENSAGSATDLSSVVLDNAGITWAGATVMAPSSNVGPGANNHEAGSYREVASGTSGGNFPTVSWVGTPINAGMPRPATAWARVRSLNVYLEPDVIEAEAEVPTGVEVVAVGDVWIAPEVIEAEVEIPAGIRLDSTGPMGVMLTSLSGPEVHLVASGTEGQVFVFHDDGPPTAEDPTPSAVGSWWVYDSATVAPPATGTGRSDGAVGIGDSGTIWLHHRDDAGLDWSDLAIEAGDELVIRTIQGYLGQFDIDVVTDTVPGPTGYWTIDATKTGGVGTLAKNQRVNVLVVRRGGAGGGPGGGGNVVGVWDAADPGTPAQDESLWYDTDADTAIPPSEAHGTAFPVSPTSGLRFYRTDVRGGMWFRYDGTRWLSEQLFTLPLANWNVISADATAHGYPLPTDYDIYVTNADFVFYSGTAGGTWTYYIRRALFDESSYPDLVSQAFTGYTAARWYNYRVTVNTVVVTTGGNTGTSTRALMALADETAGTATIYASAQIEYRLVAT